MFNCGQIKWSGGLVKTMALWCSGKRTGPLGLQLCGVGLNPAMHHLHSQAL